MNKIESILYFEMAEIPTLHINILDRTSIEQDIFANIRPSKHGLVARSGGRPSSSFDSRPDGNMPWHATKPLLEYASPHDQLLELAFEAEKIYSQLNHSQVVFIHPQRNFEKSGVLRVDSCTATIEAVTGWPEALSHGKLNPVVRYVFTLPSLFLSPIKVDGQEDFLNQAELFMVGKKIERRLDYKFLLEQLHQSLAVEFSFGGYRWGYDVSAHDIQAGRAHKFQTWYDIAKSIRSNKKGGYKDIHTETLVELVEEVFGTVLGLLDKPVYTLSSVQKEAQRLSQKYDVLGYTEAPVSTMGSRNNEKAAYTFLSHSVQANRIQGVPITQLEQELKENDCYWAPDRSGPDLGIDPYTRNHIQTTRFFVNKGYAIEVKTPSGSELWPTEAMLINQKVPKRKILRL